MRRYAPLLTDARGKKIEPLLPRPPRHRRRGRFLAPNRRVLEDALWILRSVVRWQGSTNEFPSTSTCGRRLRGWDEQGV